jgi:hypothetical protein
MSIIYSLIYLQFELFTSGDNSEGVKVLRNNNNNNNNNNSNNNGGCAGPYEHGNEPSGSIHCGEFLD